MSNETVARYPFSLTVHMKNGTPLYLDHAIQLNGDWEMCLSQLYLPRSEITVFSDEQFFKTCITIDSSKTS